MSEPLCIPAGNPGAMTGRGNNTWLLIGPEPTLIDAGVGMPSHLDAIESALGGQELHRVLVTHGHADHASGVPALRARWPGLTSYKWPAADDADGWSVLGAGQKLRAGDRLLEVVHTPGHALDHVCFWDPHRRYLYAGDMLVQGSTVMIPASRGGGLRAYLNSLERLAALDPIRVFPGHGPIIEDPTGLIAEYVSHRRMRDEQVTACLRDGVTDLDEMVARIYPDLAPALRSAARATVEAHVLKLRDGGI